MYVGIYSFLDKAKVFDDYLAHYFPNEKVLDDSFANTLYVAITLC